eukprot:5099342-Prymnesium_polylepis.1
MAPDATVLFALRTSRRRGGATSHCDCRLPASEEGDFGDVPYYYHVFDNLVSEARRQGARRADAYRSPTPCPLAGGSAFGLALSRRPPG